MEQDKRFCALKKTFRRFFGNKENTTIIYLNGNLTIVENQLSNNKDTSNKMIINGNIYNCTIITNDTNIDSHNNGYRKEPEVEEVDYEEVKVESKQENSVNLHNNSTKDYSKSPLIPYLTYPEHAQYFIGWLHLSMDNQKSNKDFIMPLKAATERGLFKRPIPYEVFKEEFGDKVKQYEYSKLMNGTRIKDADLDLVLETLDMSKFK